MYVLTNIESDLIRSRANQMVNDWIQQETDYNHILKEVHTIPSCYLVLHIHLEALNIFIEYISSCNREILSYFGIEKSSPEELDRVILMLVDGMNVLRERIDQCME